MLLKSYLQALLGRFYSKDEHVLVAQQSLPSGTVASETTLSPANSERSAVAPCDGFVVISSTEFKATNIQVNCNGISSTYANPGGDTFAAMWAPVSKGETVTYFLSGANGVIRFIRSVGGGVAKAHIRAFIWQILRGGLPCLKISCRHCSQVSVVHTNQFRQPPIQKQFCSSMQTVTPFANSSHRQTAWLPCSFSKTAPGRALEKETLRRIGSTLSVTAHTPPLIYQWQKVRDLSLQHSSRVESHKLSALLCSFTNTLANRSGFAEEVCHA